MRLVVKKLEKKSGTFVFNKVSISTAHRGMVELKELSDTTNQHQRPCQKQNPPTTMSYDTVVDSFNLTAPPNKKKETLKNINFDSICVLHSSDAFFQMIFNLLKTLVEVWGMADERRSGASSGRAAGGQWHDAADG